MHIRYHKFAGDTEGLYKIRRYYDVISRTYDANIDSLFRQTALNLTQIGFAYFSRQCKFDTFVFSYLFIFFAFVLGFLFAS